MTEQEKEENVIDELDEEAIFELDEEAIFELKRNEIKNLYNKMVAFCKKVGIE